LGALIFGEWHMSLQDNMNNVEAFMIFWLIGMIVWSPSLLLWNTGLPIRWMSVFAFSQLFLCTFAFWVLIFLGAKP
jgi:hypothetical protein